VRDVPFKGDDAGTASDNAGDSRAEYIDPSRSADVVDNIGLVEEGCVMLGELRGSCVVDVPDTDGPTDGVDGSNVGAVGGGGGCAAPEDGGVAIAVAGCADVAVAGEATAAAAAAEYRMGGSCGGARVAEGKPDLTTLDIDACEKLRFGGGLSILRSICVLLEE
jgi:hypothetical protein